MNRSVIRITSLLLCLIVLDQSLVYAQKRKDKAKIKSPVAVPGATPIITKPITPPGDVLKSYEEIIPATAVTSIGFFKVHKVADKYFLEIPDSLLGRELLTVNRISRSAADFRKPEARTVAYAGDMIGESVFNFVKGPANKLFLSVTSYKERSSDTSENGLSRSLLKSTMQPLISSFAVRTEHKINKTSVIEITDYINGDNAIFGFSNAKKALSGLSMPSPDRSYIESIKAFSTNIEVKSIKTYQKQDPVMGTAVFTFEMNSSIILLPKVPMKVREYDDRVGYLAEEYTDFDLNPRGVKTIANIQRWRLEPKPEDLDKYHKGMLVEPKKPIVIYIDPSTPKKWVAYLIQGINDWQPAFEKAGFKNAIIGLEAPVNDTTWNIDDVRHNVLVYKPTEVAAFINGDVVCDPRSGEILEAHINWYHNTLNDLYKTYLIQAGATDPRARSAEFSDELMGSLIRSACSQQIGSKLGLKFNLGASAMVPVANLRKAAVMEISPASPSIMDFYRYNYVAQPEDNLPINSLIPRIGDYDKWAIEWGYRIIPGNETIAEENKILNNWIVQKLKESKQYTFVAEPGISGMITDPRSQKDDLGDDAVLASSYGIKNLKRVAPNLLSWTRKPYENYDRAGKMYQELINQYERYLQHVAFVIGGIYTTSKMSGQTGVVYSFPTKEKQQLAMKFLQREAFSTPLWLKNDALYKLTYTSFNPAMTVQKNILLLLLDARCMSKLISAESYNSSKAYTATEMLTELKKGVFAELAQRQAITMPRRELQKAYVLKLSTMVQSGVGADGESGSVIRAHAKELLSDISLAVSAITDKLSKAHLEDLKDRLYLILYNPSALPVSVKKAI